MVKLEASFSKHLAQLTLQQRQMVDDDTPEDVGREAVVAMDNVVACVHNPAGIRNLDVRDSFQDSVHGFAHNLYVPFHRTPKHEVVMELLK